MCEAIEEIFADRIEAKYEAKIEMLTKRADEAEIRANKATACANKATARANKAEARAIRAEEKLKAAGLM